MENTEGRSPDSEATSADGENPEEKAGGSPEGAGERASAVRLVAPLLFGSGMCALIYQLTWTREFRLIFGASTGASAAVLAIFIGGLGLGGFLLGKRADETDNPLLLYARLEALVSLLAAITPGLLWLVRKVYLGLGGTTTLGIGGGTVVRLLLSVLVLAGPTVAMGGTLPAAARAIARRDDDGRRDLALLYGVNTFGAVTGSLLANFAMLEIFGARLTLWMACLVNLLVAVLAIRVSREVDQPPQDRGDESASATDQKPEAPAIFVLGAAAAVGFAFFLMELVWYRMLGPILGGTVFTFGLILAVALLGIGLGGGYYAFVGRQRAPTLVGFAYTCLLEGLFIIIPYALGDRIALFSLTLREVGKLGFSGFLFNWGVITALVVLPAAFVSGVQFPMLIALLGRGRREVGRQIGLTYAWNTVGAIVGSLAGGFGLLPFLGARGCWRLIAVLLAALGGGAIALALRSGRRGSLLGPAALLLAVLALQGAQGPTALWRHSGIGAGRFRGDLRSDNDIDQERNHLNQTVIWEKEGVESSVSLQAIHSLSFVVNGKSDGNALADSATQVMSGLLGLVIHPDAKSSLVIGLGTGSTAGWLGVAPGMERVDVVEIEPAIVDVARYCAQVNERVLENPKVHLQLADAREVLQTTPHRYDLIFSEPSNPYRAGIASMYTQEFYQAAIQRLSEQGIFMQWMQGYEITGQTLRTVYATLRSTFPHVETWVLDPSDMLLVASRHPKTLDVERLRALIQKEPLRSALAATWRVNDLEGVLAHFVASDRLSAAVAREEGNNLNTDDLCPVEFGFARSVGQQRLFSVGYLATVARGRNEHRPLITNGKVNWRAVEDRQLSRFFASEQIPSPQPHHSPDHLKRISAMQRFAGSDFPGALASWNAQTPPAREIADLTELAFVGDSLAGMADEKALPLADKLGEFLPLEALVIRAHLRARQKNFDEATTLLEQAFVLHRSTPWAWKPLTDRALRLALELNTIDRRLGLRLLPALAQPFAVRAQESARLDAAFRLSVGQPDKSLCVEHLRPFEPHIPWDEEFLRARHACYEGVNHPLLRQAERDLLRFLNQAGMRFDAGLPLPPNLPRRPPPSASALPSASAAPFPSVSASASSSATPSPPASASGPGAASAPPSASAVPRGPAPRP